MKPFALAAALTLVLCSGRVGVFAHEQTAHECCPAKGAPQPSIAECCAAALAPAPLRWDAPVDASTPAVLPAAPALQSRIPAALVSARAAVLFASAAPRAPPLG